MAEIITRKILPKKFRKFLKEFLYNLQRDISIDFLNKVQKFQLRFFEIAEGSFKVGIGEQNPKDILKQFPNALSKSISSGLPRELPKKY